MFSHSNYHSHSAYSDGQGKLTDFVNQAIALGMNSIGFSEHAPVPFNTFWNMPANKVETYIAEIECLKTQYNGQIEIYTGLETDYYAPWQNQIIETALINKLDYHIGSIHFLSKLPNGKPWNTDSTKEEFDEGYDQIFNKNGRKLTESFFSETVDMIRYLKPVIIGHIDKIKMFNISNNYFDESAAYYKDAVALALSEAQKFNCIIEFNTRGLYRHGNKMPYPSLWLLKEIKRRNLRLCLNSDCHSPFEITAAFNEALQLITEAGFNSLWQLCKNKWVEVPL